MLITVVRQVVRPKEEKDKHTKGDTQAPFMPIAIVVRQKQESKQQVPNDLACQLMEALAQVAATAIALSQDSYKAKWMRAMVNHQSPEEPAPP